MSDADLKTVAGFDDRELARFRSLVLSTDVHELRRATAKTSFGGGGGSVASGGSSGGSGRRLPMGAVDEDPRGLMGSMSRGRSRGRSSSR